VDRRYAVSSQVLADTDCLSTNVLLRSSRVRHIVLSLPSTASHTTRSSQKGISNDQSTKVPLVHPRQLNRGQAGMSGKGLNVWPNMHTTRVKVRSSVLTWPAVDRRSCRCSTVRLHGKTGRVSKVRISEVGNTSVSLTLLSMTRHRSIRRSVNHRTRRPSVDLAAFRTHAPPTSLRRLGTYCTKRDRKPFTHALHRGGQKIPWRAFEFLSCIARFQSVLTAPPHTPGLTTSALTRLQVRAHAPVWLDPTSRRTISWRILVARRWRLQG